MLQPPEHLEKRGDIGWGNNGNYIVKEGFKLLQTDTTIASTHIWKKVWHPDCIPKVNSFIWMLMYNKLLIVDNLNKTGIEGLSRCALCNFDSKTTSHLFLQCSLSQQAWRSILLPLFAHFRPPNSLGQLLVGWNSLFPGSLRKKPILKLLWNSIPKNLYWHIWLAKNRSIFKGEKVVLNNIV